MPQKLKFLTLIIISMKTKFYSIISILTLSFGAMAQGVGINETGTAPDASAGLDVSFNNRGFLPPRLTTNQRDAIANPAAGLMVYNTTFGCLQVNEGTPSSPYWICITGIYIDASTNGTGIVSGYGTDGGCAAPVFSDDLIEGEDASAITLTVQANVTTLGTYTLVAGPTNGVTFTASGTFTSIGCQDIVFTASGSPTTAGSTTWEAISNPIMSATATVLPPPPVFSANYVHCDPANPTVIVEVLSPATGRTWMDRNLGADQLPTVQNDGAGYGSLFQWGRFADGHQCVNHFGINPNYSTSGVYSSSSQASSSDPNQGNAWDGLFFLSFNNPFDWLSTQNTFLWQGVGGANNPCPSGYRIPSIPEFQAEAATWSTMNNAGAFASPLKIPQQGQRIRSNGNLGYSASAFYWTNTVDGIRTRGFLINAATTGSVNNDRAFGNPVRCIKD